MYHSFHKDIKQRNCIDNNKKCFFIIKWWFLKARVMLKTIVFYSGFYSGINYILKYIQIKSYNNISQYNSCYRIFDQTNAIFKMQILQNLTKQNVWAVVYVASFTQLKYIYK